MAHIITSPSEGPRDVTLTCLSMALTTMRTKTAEPIDLPAPVAAYFAADTTGAEAVAQCFTDGAVVIDERQEYRGRTAIARWKVEASTKFRYTVERLGAICATTSKSRSIGSLLPTMFSKL